MKKDKGGKEMRKKVKKRLLGLALSVCMVCSSLTGVFADEVAAGKSHVSEVELKTVSSGNLVGDPS